MELSAAQAFRGRDIPERVFSEFTLPDDWIGRQAAGTLWVGDIDGGVEAFLGATAHGDRLHIDEFAVAREHQGKGLGKRIVSALVDHLRAHAPKTAYVSLIADGDAQYLYAKYGFEPVMPASIGMAFKVT